MRLFHVSAFLLLAAIHVYGQQISSFLETNAVVATNKLAVLITPLATNGTRSITVSNLALSLGQYMTNAVSTTRTNGTTISAASTSINFIAGTNVVLRGTNAAGAVSLEINSASGTGSGVTTNADQFGASVALTIKSGALLTNTSLRTATTVGELSVSGGANFPTMTGSRAALFNANGDVTNSAAVFDVELEFLDGVTSGIQSQINARQSGFAALTNISGLASTVFTNVPRGGTNISVRTAGGTNFIDTTGQLNNWSQYATNAFIASGGGLGTNIDFYGITTNHNHIIPGADISYDLGDPALATWRNLSVQTILSTNIQNHGYVYLPRYTVGQVLHVNSQSDLTNSTGVAVTPGTITFSNQVSFTERNGGSDAVILKAPISLAASRTFVLPETNGLANQVLQEDGSGNLSWVTQSGGGGPSTSNNIPSSAVTVFGTAPATNLLFDASVATVFRVLLTNNMGLWITNGSDGQDLRIELYQDGTGNRTVTHVANTGGAQTNNWQFGTDITSPITLTTNQYYHDLIKLTYTVQSLATNTSRSNWACIGFVRGYAQ